jgi:hypothetical protein
MNYEIRKIVLEEKDNIGKLTGWKYGYEVMLPVKGDTMGAKFAKEKMKVKHPDNKIGERHYSIIPGSEFWINKDGLQMKTKDNHVHQNIKVGIQNETSGL